MIFRSENYIEGGSTWFFSKHFLSPIRTKLLSVIVYGQLNSGIVKVPAIEPIFCCGSQKYGFFGFLRFSLKRKNPGKFFSTRKKRLDKGNPTVQNSLPYVA
jgi:hypothetical protein